LLPRLQAIAINDPRRRRYANSGAGSKGTGLQGSGQRPPHVSLGGEGFRVADQYMRGWQTRRVPDGSERIFLGEFIAPDKPGSRAGKAASARAG
jgi:hypothetical protein